METLFSYNAYTVGNLVVIEVSDGEESWDQATATLPTHDERVAFARQIVRAHMAAEGGA